MYRKYYGLRNKPFGNAPDARTRSAPFTEEELKAHVFYRLRIAGADRPIFTAAALKKIHALTGGIPASVHQLCDHALQAGFMVGKKNIDYRLVLACVRELNATLPRGFTRLRPQPNQARQSTGGPAVPAATIKAAPHPETRAGWLPLKKLGLAAAVLLLAVFTGYALYGHLYVPMAGGQSSEAAVHDVVEVLQNRTGAAGPLVDNLSFGHQMAEDTVAAKRGHAQRMPEPGHYERQIIRRKIEIPAARKIEIAETLY